MIAARSEDNIESGSLEEQAPMKKDTHVTKFDDEVASIFQMMVMEREETKSKTLMNEKNNPRND